MDNCQQLDLGYLFIISSKKDSYYLIQLYYKRIMSLLSQQLAIMRNQLDEAETHVKSLEAGRKSSSAKARSNLMKIKSQSHELRKAVMSHTKTIPVKSRQRKKRVYPLKLLK